MYNNNPKLKFNHFFTQLSNVYIDISQKKKQKSRRNKMFYYMFYSSGSEIKSFTTNSAVNGQRTKMPNDPDQDMI